MISLPLIPIKLKVKMINKAIEKYGKIFPCSCRDLVDYNANRKIGLVKESFTIFGEFVILWYNTCDHSTHVVREKLV
jgi:hypothetical protein